MTKFRFTKVVAALLLVSLLTIACLHKSPPEPPPPEPQPTSPVQQAPLKQVGLVNDYANVFDDAAKTRLLFTINELRTNSDVQFVVATVESTNGQSIFDYSLALARDWRPGGESGRGLLLVLAIRDRQWRLQVSKALEKDLPDQVCKELGTRSEELYKQGKYAEGIDLYVRAIGDKLQVKR